jgi:hypothetical protein
VDEVEVVEVVEVRRRHLHKTMHQLPEELGEEEAAEAEAEGVPRHRHQLREHRHLTIWTHEIMVVSYVDQANTCKNIVLSWQKGRSK